MRRHHPRYLLIRKHKHNVSAICSVRSNNVSQFLSILADRNIPIANQWKAVEGISGAAVVYLICAVCLTCCLGGIAAFAFVAIVLDVLFAGGMIAIAVMTRDGAKSCKGDVNTPIGSGPANQDHGFGDFGNDSGENVTYSVHLGLACRLNTAAFAVSIIAALLFLVTAAMQVLLVRHHKKEKRYGPSPSNNYTSGYGSKFGFGRKKKTGGVVKDSEAGHGGLPAENRVSHETGYTGTTVGGPGYDTYGSDKVGTTQPAYGGSHGAHSGYYTVRDTAA